MKTLIVDNHSKHTNQLAEMFENSLVIEKGLFSKENAEGFDLVVFSGGSGVPSLVDNADYYQEEMEFIKNTEKAVIGICLGCEMVCKAFGGELQFMLQQEKGEKLFEIIDPVVKEELHESDIKCYEAHSVRMTKVPEIFNILVISNHGPEIIKHQTLPIIGVQFHPEVESPKELWQWILKQVEL